MTVCTRPRTERRNGAEERRAVCREDEPKKKGGKQTMPIEIVTRTTAYKFTEEGKLI